MPNNNALASIDPYETDPSQRLLRARRLFDGTSTVSVPSVLVEGGMIRATGAAAEAAASADPTIVVSDLGDVTLLPGLIDCHQHLVFDGRGSLEEQVADASDAELLERARANARRALLGGVTTIRDLGDRNFVTLALRHDPELPTILCAGPPITPVQGHCWYLGGECEDRDAMIAAVRRRIEMGCDVVKIMATGGAMTPTTPMWKSQFGRRDLDLVVHEAHAAGVRVAAHCHGLTGIEDSIAAGVDTIEHCTFVDESMQIDPDPSLLRQLAESNTVISATLGVMPNAELPPPMLKMIPAVIAALASVREMGGRIVVGSDAGIAPFKPHDVMPHAIHDLVAIGMPVAEALHAMTRGGALALGLESKGIITVGADADLIAVDGDPLADVEAITRVVGVWQDGREIEVATRELSQR